MVVAETGIGIVPEMQAACFPVEKKCVGFDIPEAQSISVAAKLDDA